jgi:uncharacterized protein
MATKKFSGGTFLMAAEKVLREAGEPLTTLALTVRAIEKGYLVTTGKTPSASMGAVLYVDVRDNPESSFKRVATRGAQRAIRGSVRWSLK